MAGGASWSSVISTIISYLQKLGVTVSLDDTNLPDDMKNIISTVYQFFKRVQSWIPLIPDFDLRAQLMLLALTLPFLLDIVFVWFINTISFTIMHLLDLVAFGVGTFFLTYSIIAGWSFANISIMVVCFVFILLRIVFLFLTKSKNDVELYVIVDEICNYYMQGILPDKECELSFQELNMEIHKYSEITEIMPPKANLLHAYSYLAASFVFLFVGFWCLDAFPIPYDFPPIVSLFLTIICFPLGVVFFLSYALRLFHAGRVFLTKFKQFIRRWGFRLLMMALDLLYIPILSVLITLITPFYLGCPKDEYLYYQVKDESNFLYPFINHTVTCIPCLPVEYRSEFCDYKCSGISELRMKEAPNLLFVDDVLKMSTGLIVYTAVVIMVGLPYLWRYIIKRNYQYINRINVYGKTEERKYATLIHRLRSTGVFMFQDYKSKYVMWGVFLLGSKFILMLIEVLQETLATNLVFALPPYYLISFILHVTIRPFLYRFNTVLESIGEFMNLVFSIFTIFLFKGFTIPDYAILPISIVMLVVPVISVICLLFCEGKEGTKRDLEDPTFVRKANTKSVKNKKKNKGEEYQETVDEQENQNKKKRYRIGKKSSGSIDKHLIETNPDGNANAVYTQTLTDCSSELSSVPKEYYKPYTSRVHYHPDGHHTRPATPLPTVSGVPSRYPTRPQTARIFDSDAENESDISSDTIFLDPLLNIDPDDQNNKKIKKHKNRHHHYHDQESIIVDSKGNKQVIQNYLELEDGMLDSILELKLKGAEKRWEGQIYPDDTPIRECFTIKKNSAARRMTKMYKTLDIVLDGSTIDKLTKILNNAMIVGVVAAGWYLGTVMATYKLSSNFTCG